MRQIQSTRQRVKNLTLTLNDAVINGFSSEVIKNYQTQLISLLVEIAQENHKKRQARFRI